LSQCTRVTDRRTDRQTDGQNYDSEDRPRICSRGNKINVYVVGRMYQQYNKFNSLIVV